MSVYSEALAKREWADQHIGKLKTALAKLRESDPCTIAAKKNPETGDLTYYVEHIPIIPAEIPLIIGDILHNLRCALDYIACGLVGDNCVTSKTKFPIRLDPHDWEVSGLRMVDGASKEAIETLRRLRPYEGGDSRFCILHALNNIDKHRLLLTVCAKNVMQTGFQSGEIIDEQLRQIGQFRLSSEVSVAVQTSDRIPFGSLYAGQKLLTVPAAQAKQQVGFTIVVAFSEPALAKGMPVWITMFELKRCVDRAISELAPFLP